MPDSLHDTYTSKADRLRLGGSRIRIVVDADVIGLWADIKSAMYQELNSNQATGHGNGDVYHKKSIRKSE